MQTIQSLLDQVTVLRNQQQAKLQALNVAEQALATAVYQGNALAIVAAQKVVSAAKQEISVAQANLQVYEGSVNRYNALSKTTNQSMSDKATAAKYAKGNAIIGNTGI